MPINIQLILNSNMYLKRFLHENSYYYKKLIRHPSFINELNKLMREYYQQTIPSKLEKFKDNLNFISNFIDVLN